MYVPPAIGLPQAIAGLNRHCRAAATATRVQRRLDAGQHLDVGDRAVGGDRELQLELALDPLGLGGDGVLEIGARRPAPACSAPRCTARRRPRRPARPRSALRPAPRACARCATTPPRRRASAPRRPPRAPGAAAGPPARCRPARRRCSSPARSPRRAPAPPAAAPRRPGATLGAVATTRGAWCATGGGGGGGLGGSPSSWRRRRRPRSPCASRPSAPRPSASDRDAGVNHERDDDGRALHRLTRRSAGR